MEKLENFTPTFSSPVFQTGADDNLRQIDVYKEKGNKIFNGIQDWAKRTGISEGISDLIRGGKSAAKLLPVIKDLGSAASRGNFIARFTATMPHAQRALAALGKEDGSFMSRVSENFNQYGDIGVKVAGVVSKVQAADFKNITSVGALINSVNKDAFEYVDQDSLAGMTCGIIDEATRYGIPNSFKALTEQITDHDLLGKISRGSIGTAIDNSDIGLLKDINGALREGNLWSLAPQAIQDFASEYKHQLGATIDDVKESYSLINTTFSEINGEWKIHHRETDEGVDTIVDGSALTFSSLQMSETFQLGALESAEIDDKAMLIAFEFQQVDVASAIKSSFPFTYGKSLDSKVEPILFNQTEAFAMAYAVD